MKRLIFAIFLLALPLAAQTEAPPHQVQKLFVLKYADADNVYNLLRVFPNTNIIPNKEMHTLAIATMSNVMPGIEDAINRLDLPSAAPKNIDLTVYLVIGGEAEGPMPGDLQPVITQLKTAFPFKTYRVLDTLTLRTRTGLRAETQSSGGALQVGGGRPQAVNTSFRITSASLAADGTTVRLDGLSASCRIPYEVGNGINYRDLGMSTDVDIKEGQKVVVGRLGIEPDQALVLVLTARVVQ